MARKYAILVSVALAVLLADQWSKFAVVDALTTRFADAPGLGGKLKALYSEAPPAGPYGLHFVSKRSITVSDDYFRLRYAENPGAAWGLFRTLPDHLRGPLFHVVSLAAVVFIVFFFRQLKGVPEEKWALFGLPLVLGGAVGNYVDRLARGYVIDFLEAHWHDRAAWPSFNVADAAICVGVGMLMVDSFIRKEAPRASGQAQASGPASAKVDSVEK